MSASLQRNPRGNLRRFGRLARAELGFAARYGILPLYGVIAVIYVALLSAVAPEARPSAGGVIALTDPAAMGLFFMGAIILLEKSQRVHWALAASLVRVGEYVAAKVLALLCAGLPVGLLVAVYAGLPLGSSALSLALSSTLFTLLGLWLAAESGSLNQFLLLTIPVELVAFVPAMFYWYGALTSPLWLLNPGVATLALFTQPAARWPAAALSLLCWNAVAYGFCRRAVGKFLNRLGGSK